MLYDLTFQCLYLSSGRTGPGVCFRLYSEDDYGEFDQYSTPEIHRVPLDSLVLQMAGLGLHDPTLFPFIESPQKSHLANAVYFLKAQNALTSEGELTTIGNMLSKLPVDICIGKMLIMGCLFSIVDPVLVIAAALSVQSPLTRRFSGGADDTEHRRKEFFTPHGDPFTLLNIYDEWILVKSDRSINSRKWCKRRGFEEQRFYEISKLRKQFEGILRDHKLLTRRGGGEREDLDRNEKRKSMEQRLERKRLAKIKREHGGNAAKRRKKKMLKMENHYEASDGESEVEEDGSTKVDLNDIEFKMRHDLMKLEASSRRSRQFTIRDVNLLKLIVASGLFPQIVLPDESNQYRKQTEQVYHSKDKQFLTLHPTSVYCLENEFLDSMYQVPSSFSSTNNIKKNEDRGLLTRELLVYVSLLETNKAYLINPMKVHALQTLFLLSNTIDTNSDFTCIVFNEWIELSFQQELPDESGEKKEVRSRGEELVSKVVQLRKSWDDLLQQKLLLQENEEEDEEKEKEETKKTQKRIESLETDVSFALAGFIDTQVDYTIRRVTSVESKSMYVGPAEEFTADPFNTPLTAQTPNHVKGGVFLTPYLTYGCLKDDMSVAVCAGEAEYLVQHYHCERCEEHLICTVVERIQHDESCALKHTNRSSENPTVNEGEIVEGSDSEHKSKNLKSYVCDLCNKTMELTPTDILKHKKSHL